MCLPRRRRKGRRRKPTLGTRTLAPLAIESISCWPLAHILELADIAADRRQEHDLPPAKPVLMIFQRVSRWRRWIDCDSWDQGCTSCFGRIWCRQALTGLGRLTLVRMVAKVFSSARHFSFSCARSCQSSGQPASPTRLCISGRPTGALHRTCGLFPNGFGSGPLGFNGGQPLCPHTSRHATGRSMGVPQDSMCRVSGPSPPRCHRRHLPKGYAGAFPAFFNSCVLRRKYTLHVSSLRAEGPGAPSRAEACATCSIQFSVSNRYPGLHAMTGRTDRCSMRAFATWLPSAGHMWRRVWKATHTFSEDEVRVGFRPTSIWT